jgi:succinate-acetate transporter protein
LGNLLFLQNLGNPNQQEPNATARGVYYSVFMLFIALLALCTYLSPHGSWSLMAILGIVVVQLVVAAVEYWIPHRALVIARGVLGVAVCLLAIYTFVADSLAEHGVMIRTGKFGGMKTRHVVRQENAVGQDQ